MTRKHARALTAILAALTVICALVCANMSAVVKAAGEGKDAFRYYHDGDETPEGFVKVTVRPVMAYYDYVSHSEGKISISRWSQSSPDKPYELDGGFSPKVSRQNGWQATFFVRRDDALYFVGGFTIDNNWREHFHVSGTEGLGKQFFPSECGEYNEMTVYAEVVNTENPKTIEMPEKDVYYGPDVPDFYIWNPKGMWSLLAPSTDPAESSANTQSSTEDSGEESSDNEQSTVEESKPTESKPAESDTNSLPDASSEAQKPAEKGSAAGWIVLIVLCILVGGAITVIIVLVRRRNTRT